MSNQDTDELREKIQELLSSMTIDGNHIPKHFVSYGTSTILKLVESDRKNHELETVDITLLDITLEYIENSNPKPSYKDGFEKRGHVYYSLREWRDALKTLKQELERL